MGMLDPSPTCWYAFFGGFRKETMEFRLLGPVEAWHEGRELALGGPKPRAVLAALLLEPGRVVSIDRLAGLAWNERPPDTARTLILTYISRLRRCLSVADAGEMIERTPPGYLIRLRDARLDRDVFDGLVGEGRRLLDAGRLVEAADAFGSALAVWRGASLGGVGGSLRAEAARLDETRLEVIEKRITVESLLGRYGELLPELTALVNEYTTRERLRGLLMTVLCGLGRQSDALAVYQEGRAILSRELGIDPAPDLQRLHAVMLRAGLLTQRSPSKPVRVDAAIESSAWPGVAPAQLPRAVPDFIGREDVIADLVTRLAESGHAPPVCVVSGKGGVGKSATAVHTAHLIAGFYPDGQLFADLRGCTDSPATPEDIMARFLRALGVDAAFLPESFQERVDVYRSILSRRRVLVVLDDARSESQVRPLLPGGPGCAVLITSRARFARVAGAHLTDLDVLDEHAAIELLTSLAGRARIDAEPDAAARIVRLCGCLPLAVRTAGARLAMRRHWPLGTLVGRLSDERRCLDELAVGDLEVRSSVGAPHHRRAPPRRRTAGPGRDPSRSGDRTIGGAGHPAASGPSQARPGRRSRRRRRCRLRPGPAYAGDGGLRPVPVQRRSRARPGRGNLTLMRTSRL